MTFDIIRDKIDNGIPLILSMPADGDAHAVAIMGYAYDYDYKDETNYHEWIIYYDPGRKTSYMDMEEFEYYEHRPYLSFEEIK